MNQHSPFAPSKMSRILQCRASFDAHDTESNVYADEGTLMHDYIAKAIAAMTNDVPFDINRGHDTFRHDEALTAEQKHTLVSCLEYFMQVVEDHEEEVSQTLLIETKVQMGGFHGNLKEMHGTADIIMQVAGWLIVLDWKFGQGVRVEAEENTQLKLYALGAHSMKTIHERKNIRSINLIVAQPRLDNFSCYPIDIYHLIDWAINEVVPTVGDILAGNRDFSPSASACQWCPWRTKCGPRNAMAMENAVTVFQKYTNIIELDLEQVGQLIAMASDIEKVIKDAKALASQALSSGQAVPGYKMVEGRANRVWANEAAVGALLEDLGIECYESKLISPAAAEKLLSTATKKEIGFDGFIIKPKGQPTLVPDTDPRPAMKLGAENTFKHLIANDEE